MKKILLLSILLQLGNFVFAQNEYSSSNVKAIRYFQNAERLNRTSNFDEALEYLEKALGQDTAFVEALELQADIYHEKEEFEKEIEVYLKLLPYQQYNDSKIYMFLADAQFNLGRYTEASNNYKKALVSKGLTQRERNNLKRDIVKVRMAIEAVGNPVPFEPLNMGTNVNSSYHDYWPSLTADEGVLTMTRKIPSKKLSAAGEVIGQEDFFVCTKGSDGKWQKAVNIGPPINTPLNEGAQSISFNGQFIFFTSCQRNDGYGRCDLYFSERIGDKWSEPQNMGKPINTSGWESQPSFSSDGRTLYFVSDRIGGYGKLDIWKSELDDYGRWSNPVNLGDSINTPQDDTSPFIHQDNNTLYFASDGHAGLGNQDIFISRKNASGQWSKPVNLGYPINTYNDEYGLIVTPQGETAIYASDRTKETGRDLYTFELYEDIRPLKVSFVKGVVVDSDSKEELKADFELSDLETAEVVVKTNSIAGAGEYLVCLPVNKDYGLNVSKKGYLFHSENFSLKNSKDPTKPYEINIALQTIQVGRKEVLRNIFFETDSYELKKQSQAELMRLVRFMKENPEVRIEIGGHTDNVGTEQYNQELSELRAKAVYDYLLSNGLSPERLGYKGYSYSQPYTSNETSTGRAQNRRTEFKIIEIDNN